jgi:myo-inositol-1(or 4)-monophosphatase
MNFEKITTEVRELAAETATFIGGEVNSISAEKIESKSLHNFVTYVDKTSEERLIAGLSRILPDSGFIAEEGTKKNENRQYTWVIDPLDGTTNFLHGLPPYAISIALMENDQVHLGVIHEVYSGECFWACDNSPAFLNGTEIRVSQVSRLKDSLIATGFPYSDFDKIKPFMQTLEYLFNHSHGVRRLGSAAIDIAYLAAGRFEGFYEYGLSPWDVAAGVKILLQAGGKICDFHGGTQYIFGREIIASNAGIHEEFSSVISSYLRK